MPELERRIWFKPAFDCISVRPCHFGKDATCQPGKGGSHGRGSVTMTMLLIGDAGAVQFSVFTGWQLDETPPSPHSGAAELGVHSKRPQYDDHEPRDECEFLGAPCYYDEGYMRADEAWRLLRYEGHEAVWQHLEERYYAPLLEAIA